MSDIATILQRLQKGHLSVQGLTGASRAYLTARIKAASPDRTMVVVTPSPEEAASFVDDLHLFLDETLSRRLVLFPTLDVMPYTRLTPDALDLAHRLNILHRLLAHEPLILVTSAAAILRRLPPPRFLSTSTRTLRLGREIARDDLLQELVAIGYEDVPLVEDEGSFSKRGGIVDLWPPASPQPIRLEYDDDRIVSMRLFNPATQRSHGDRKDIELLPVREFPFSPEARADAGKRMRDLADETDLPAAERRALLDQLKEGIAFAGIDTFFPLFHERTTTLAEYLPETTLVILDDPLLIETNLKKFHSMMTDLHKSSTSPERIISPRLIIQDANEWTASFAAFQKMELNNGSDPSPITVDTVAHTDLAIVGQGKWMDLFCTWHESGTRITVVSHTEPMIERLRHFFEPYALPILFQIGRLSQGFRWDAEGLAMIADDELFGQKHIARRTTRPPTEAFSSFAEIGPGDLLVHEQHGIGKYLGLQHLAVANQRGDFLILEYLGGDKLYLPVYRLNLVERYIGSGDAIPLVDRLGGTRWATAQKKVRHEIMTIARDLLKIHALRTLRSGIAFPPTDQPYEEFCALFPYDETPDQLTAIGDTMRDMDDAKPMDRLICGDVGYGKTEVAMRAAFRVAMSGRQVAVLVPTTVLAFQHFETFTARFAATPLRIEMLSRFRSAGEQREILAELKTGKRDIVIGTHRLLQPDVEFRDLGLIVVDEEHRFGVVHKERLKKLKVLVDIITLTATPIPRTLNVALSGLRDISIMNTPPANRQSITTHVAPFDEGIVRHAIRHELERGGQVFFVHNRVQTIENMRQRLAIIVPEARIAVAHGQMKERDLEKVMIGFFHREFDLLLCTAIIESGLDIPNANTIIIHRADTFGLAQLYQLRGRVGRSSAKACAYLLTPAEGEITLIAKRRLAALTRYTELGSGFRIAMHDLELRGGGNILGSAQSGHIAAVGLDLFNKLLARTIRSMKGELEAEAIDPELNLGVDAFLPSSYVADEVTRIDLYRRLTNGEKESDIIATHTEWQDRFGPLPREAENLLKIMSIKFLAKHLRLTNVSFAKQQFIFQVDRETPLHPHKLSALIAREPHQWRLVPPNRLVHAALLAHDEITVLEEAKKALSALLACVSEPRSS